MHLVTGRLVTLMLIVVSGNVRLQWELISFNLTWRTGRSLLLGTNIHLRIFGYSLNLCDNIN